MYVNQDPEHTFVKKYRLVLTFDVTFRPSSFGHGAEPTVPGQSWHWQDHLRKVLREAAQRGLYKKICGRIITSFLKKPTTLTCQNGGKIPNGRKISQHTPLQVPLVKTKIRFFG
jgi:hypothetical protein